MRYNPHEVSAYGEVQVNNKITNSANGMPSSPRGQNASVSFVKLVDDSREMMMNDSLSA